MRFIPKTVAGKIVLLCWILFSLIVLGCMAVPAYSYLSYSPEQGDIVFQSLMKSPLVNAIEGISSSPYSHCGIVVKKKGKWMVLEAIGPVKETPLLSWFMQGRNLRIDVFRLKPAYRDNIPGMIREAGKFIGKPYDIHYKMDDENIYCSELIYKAYKNTAGDELGTLKKLGDMNWTPYVKTIEFYENGTVPKERLMITPVSIANSEKLERVN